MKPPTLFCLPLLLCVTGCFMETRTYSMLVKNELASPVSVCVTKTNSPAEHGWESPEDLAAPPHPASDQTPPGVVIPPGKTLSVENLSGRFDQDHGRAFLRVYAGTPNLTEMNAISSGSINRLDVPLNQGMNRMIIKEAGGGTMTAIPVRDLTPVPQPSHP